MIAKEIISTETALKGERGVTEKVFFALSKNRGGACRAGKERLGGLSCTVERPRFCISLRTAAKVGKKSR